MVTFLLLPYGLLKWKCCKIIYTYDKYERKAKYYIIFKPLKFFFFTFFQLEKKSLYTFSLLEEIFLYSYFKASITYHMPHLELK